MVSDPIRAVIITLHFYFNPRSPDGERLAVLRYYGDGKCISIHAPRMGSDWALIRLAVRRATFQSTLPGWGATGV